MGVNKAKAAVAELRRLKKAKQQIGNLQAQGVKQATFPEYKRMSGDQRVKARQQGRTIAVDTAQRRAARK
jgi:hypothetical protein